MNACLYMILYCEDVYYDTTVLILFVCEILFVTHLNL